MLVNRDKLEEILSPYYSGIFLLLDGIISIANDKKEIVAFKKIKKGDPILDGHMNGKVYPGFVSAECIAQAFVFLISETSEKKLKGEPRLLKIRNITFGKEIEPGDQIKIVAQWIDTKKKIFSFKGYLENQKGEKVLEIDYMEGRFISYGLIERAKSFLKKII